jgi:hypothetical protein
MQIVKVSAETRGLWERVHPFVYCGRRAGGFPESPLGNPFKVGRDGDLPTVLMKYRRWLWERLQFDSPQQRAMEALPAAAVLGCWCLNKRDAGTGAEQCHCDVIAKAWRWLKQHAAATP